VSARTASTLRRATRRTLSALVPALGVLALAAVPLIAQADPMGMRGLGRPYWHVFAAYAVAMILIGGWVVSIARRLGRIERRIGERQG
jgi:CcmD family protein